MGGYKAAFEIKAGMFMGYLNINGRSPCTACASN